MYEKLVEQMDINECGSNCSPDQYDPNRWAPEDFYDKLEEARKAADQARLKARASAARPEVRCDLNWPCWPCAAKDMPTSGAGGFRCRVGWSGCVCVCVGEGGAEHFPLFNCQDCHTVVEA